MEAKQLTVKKLILWLVIIFAAYLGFKYLLPVTVPFIIAYMVSSAIRPAADFCRRHFRVGAKAAAAVIIAVFFCLISLALYGLWHRISVEATELFHTVSEAAAAKDGPVYRLARTVGRVEKLFPFDADLASVGDTLIKAGTQRLASAAASLVGALPSFLLSLGVSLIALIYLTLDFDGAMAAVRSFLPRESADRLISLHRRTSSALWEYFRAYLILMLITFGELYLGFLILGVRYSFFLAAVVAVVDLLPVLGVGTVLLPWAAGALLLGSYRLAAGLLILYLVTAVVRQLAEPHVMGNFIGTHPFVALVGSYLGLRFFGIVGMIAAPLVLHLLKSLSPSSEKREKTG